MATNKKECICDLKSRQQNHDDGGMGHKAPPRHTPVADEHKSTLTSVRKKTRAEDGPAMADYD